MDLLWEGWKSELRNFMQMNLLSEIPEFQSYVK